jgi:hypothetical protein
MSGPEFKSQYHQSKNLFFSFLQGPVAPHQKSTIKSWEQYDACQVVIPK